MPDRYRYSDELLNAYVDGELDSEEQQHIEEAMRSDDRLRERVEEIKDLKQLVRSAYVDELPRRPSAPALRMWSTFGLAASVAAFALGVAITWGLMSYTDQGTGPRVASVADREAGVSRENGQAVKVVFHLSRNDPGHLGDVLNEAEALLTTTTQAGATASVRIIASGSGLLLFQNQATPAAERIMAMKRAYPEYLTLSGCGVAYEELREKKADGELELLPAMQLVDLGVLELMRRQREGWAYIRL
jgi:uncharacterized protein